MNPQNETNVNGGTCTKRTVTSQNNQTTEAGADETKAAGKGFFSEAASDYYVPHQLANTSNPQVPERMAYNIRETAILLAGISTKSVRRLIDRGLLKRSIGLRHILIPRSEILRYLEETTSKG